MEATQEGPGWGSSVGWPDTDCMLVMTTVPPTFGDVRLRAFEPRDADMVRELSTDPYVPLTGSLVENATPEQAIEWIGRQHNRLATGAGYSFCIADIDDDRALGQAGLWLAAIAQGRATAGYAVAPGARGRGVAAQALTALKASRGAFPNCIALSCTSSPGTWRRRGPPRRRATSTRAFCAASRSSVGDG